MAKLYPGFDMERQGEVFDVIWQGEKIASSLSFDDVASLSTDESIFLVGSGPSLNEVEAKALAAYSVCTLNGSILHFFREGLSPQYHVVCDESFVESKWEIMVQVLQSNVIGFYTPAVLSAICRRDASLLASHSFVVFQNHFKDYGNAALEYAEIVSLSEGDSDLITDDGRIGFSCDSRKGVFTAHTVLYFALQLAYTLGYRDFYLLGFDLGGKQRRFYEDGQDAAPSHLNRDYQKAILPSFQIVSKLVSGGSISVYNCSESSRLPDEVVKKTSLLRVLSILENK